MHLKLKFHQYIIFIYYIALYFINTSWVIKLKRSYNIPLLVEQSLLHLQTLHQEHALPTRSTQLVRPLFAQLIHNIGDVEFIRDLSA